MPNTRTIFVTAHGRQIACRVREAIGVPQGWIFAIHGGGTTSKYFDVGPQSAFTIFSQHGYHVVACDRPGYGDNPDWSIGFDAQVEVLADLVDGLQVRYGVEGKVPFLYGHSIGGMLALMMANAYPDRYLGISMSGSGPVYHRPSMEALNKRVHEVGDALHSGPNLSAGRARFVGPPGTFDPEIAKMDPERDVPSLVIDLKDALQWDARLPEEARRARVPVAFVMPEHDELWRADALPLSDLRAWFADAPLVDIGVQRLSGHSVLVHHIAKAHLLKTLGFIEECQVRRAMA